LKLPMQLDFRQCCIVQLAIKMADVAFCLMPGAGRHFKNDFDC
jgi:hypothetical protein